MLSMFSILFSYRLLICFEKELKKIYGFKKYKICQKPYILKVRKKSKRKPRRRENPGEEERRKERSEE
jgi:hypothetical protein